MNLLYLSPQEFKKKQLLMLFTITLILSFLVAVNFLLLFFSCNKTTRRTNIKQKQPKIIIKPETTTQQAVSQLAPTGS